MNLQRLQRMSLPFFGYCKGGGDSQESSFTDSSGSSTYDPTQSGNYKELTGGASDLFKQGQGAGNQEGVDFLNRNSETAAGGYQDAIGGGGDYQGGSYQGGQFQGGGAYGGQERTALDAAKNANLDSAGISSRRSMNDIGIASQGTGTAASGRRGIAEGIASADIYGAANRENAGMEAQFQQAGLDRQQTHDQANLNRQQQHNQAGYDRQQQDYDRAQGFGQNALDRQLQAAGGLSGMTGDIIGGMQEGDRQSDYSRQMENLLGYRDVISGDMGGTTGSEESSDTIVSRRGQEDSGSLIGQTGPGPTSSGPSSTNARNISNKNRSAV
jgi:hypothetical protein